MGIGDLTLRSNGFMTKFNLSKSTSTILIALLIVISFAAIGIVNIDAHHALLTKSFESGLVMPTLRDIENLDPPSFTISGEVQGENLLVTVIDKDANFDLNEPDEVLITANSTSSGSASASTFLEETENPGEFTGIITLSSETTSGSTLEAGRFDQISLFYEPHPGAVCIGLDGPQQVFKSVGDVNSFAREKTTVILESGGDVTTTDLLLCPDEIVNLHFRPVTQPVQISFSNGAVQTAGTDMQVTISYANAILLPGDNPALLQMYYNEHPLLGWVLVKGAHTTEGFDSATKTITSVPDQAGFISVLSDGLTEGKFVLGFDTGFGGGGGGGLVRPSLVVNALAGIGSFSGDADFSAPSMTLDKIVQLYRIDVPQEVELMIENHDSNTPIEPMAPNFFDGFDFPLVINDMGFALTGFENTIVTQSLTVGEQVTMKFLIYETVKIQHFSIYMNLIDNQNTIAQSDAQILYNDGNTIQIIDPNGFFEDVSVTIIEEEDSPKREVVVKLTFSKPMETSDLIVRTWDPLLHSVDTNILDAIKVLPNEPESDLTPPTYEEPVIEELQSQTIPKWIKNNAAWWSDQQISDSDFVSGIEYLIKNGIINIPGVEVGTSSASSEIPEWIKNNAGWWAESLITDEDFIEAMQWLLVNGVIQI